MLFGIKKCLSSEVPTGNLKGCNYENLSSLLVSYNDDNYAAQI